VIGDNAGIMTDALNWAGTFHGIGARLLREHAEQIGLDPAFTIHDREDSADLVNLIRHEKGFSKTREPLPDQGHLHLDLFALCQCRDADRAGVGSVVPVVRRMGARTERAVRGLCRSQATPERARL